MLRSAIAVAGFIAVLVPEISCCSAYIPSSSGSAKRHSQSRSFLELSNHRQEEQSFKNPLAPIALATALFTTVLISPDPALATSKTAAQVQIDAVPPKNILIDIPDLPVIGQIVSGTYARLDTGATRAVGGALGNGGSTSSITIKSPEEKVKAIQDIAGKGHLEFDVGGKLATHLDIDFATPKAGQLEVIVESPLIPKLPVKNKLTETTKTSVVRGGKKSDWSAVTNLGDGSIVYTNSKTGSTQKEKPADIY